MSTKTIYEYDDYRVFLKEAFAELKAKDKKFSYRYFSQQAGFKSQSVLKLVMDGEMNIAVASIDIFAKVFRLNKGESHFFRHLVLMNQAKTIEERTLHAEELLKSKGHKRIFPLSQQQLNYYKCWYYIPIRELVGTRGFQADPEWIAKKLNPHIATHEAKRALEDLEALGLLTRDSNGNLQQSSTNVSTGDEVTSKVVGNYHREMMKKASESIDRFPSSERDISAVTLAVPEKNLKMIKEMVQKFRKELLAAATQGMEESESGQICQINFQIFPLSDKIKPSEGAE